MHTHPNSPGPLAWCHPRQAHKSRVAASSCNLRIHGGRRIQWQVSNMTGLAPGHRDGCASNGRRSMPERTSCMQSTCHASHGQGGKIQESNCSFLFSCGLAVRHRHRDIPGEFELMQKSNESCTDHCVFLVAKEKTLDPGGRSARDKRLSVQSAAIDTKDKKPSNFQSPSLPFDRKLKKAPIMGVELIFLAQKASWSPGRLVE